MANPRTMARIAARIQERAAHCLQFELRDPRASFVTITRVEISNDLGIATVHYSVLGDEGDRSKAAHMLEHATGFVQRQVARVLRMRRTPTLRFAYDDSIEHAAAMDRLIREARERDRRIDPTLAEREANEARLAAEETARQDAERAEARRKERIADGELPADGERLAGEDSGDDLDAGRERAHARDPIDATPRRPDPRLPADPPRSADDEPPGPHRGAR